MRCIHSHSSFLPLLSQLKHKQQLERVNLLWLTHNDPARPLHRQRIPSVAPLSTTKAISTSLILGVTSPAESGDITVLLQTSAVLLFVYWIANFVVPEIISKELQKPDDDNPFKDKKGSTSTSNTSSQTETRRFNSRKQ
ncbi:hypothetical protein F0562_010083 [Nyssa sinensis]|uniref:Uncharacterized protein n=1 Tax=Nyssa sinensis TaxID=561372 RepID=A0A5J4ZZK0_9ASTE|nr:hypothetical protein F0562_010083 [Nyssa sinensis]